MKLLRELTEATNIGLDSFRITEKVYSAKTFTYIEVIAAPGAGMAESLVLHDLYDAWIELGHPRHPKKALGQDMLDRVDYAIYEIGSPMDGSHTRLQLQMRTDPLPVPMVRALLKLYIDKFGRTK